MLIVLLVVLGGVLIVNLLTPSEPVKESEPCKPHEWYSVVNEKGEDLGLTCIKCGMVPGVN